MSIKTRIRTVERNSGTGEQPELCVMTTYYERKEGGADFNSARAHVVNFKAFSQPCLGLRTEPGETFKGFIDRICDEVETHFAARPKNEQELKDKAQEQL